jgi:hypothetical protein
MSYLYVVTMFYQLPKITVFIFYIILERQFSAKMVLIVFNSIFYYFKPKPHETACGLQLKFFIRLPQGVNYHMWLDCRQVYRVIRPYICDGVLNIHFHVFHFKSCSLVHICFASY